MEPWMLITLQAAVAVVMLIGIAGTVIPVLPGLVIIWLAALGYYIVIGFNGWAWFFFALQTIMMVVGSLIDNVLMGTAARKYGASWLAIGLALVAGVIASFILSPVGGLLIALLVMFLVEFLRLNDWKAAYESARGLFLGCGWGVIIRAALGVFMLILWAVWAFLR